MDGIIVILLILILATMEVKPCQRRTFWFFPAFSVAWNIAEEPLLKRI